MTDIRLLHTRVLPTSAGSHYGTLVEVEHPNGRRFTINVWMPVGRPSAAALREWGVTPDGWDANVDTEDGCGGTEPIRRMFPSDQHYQSEFEAAVADRIADALRDLAWPCDDSPRRSTARAR